MRAVQKQDKEIFDLIKKEEKRQVIVFVDASNIIYGCNRAGWKMDFKKLFQYLTTRFGAKRILYYAGLDSRNKKQLLFYELLQRFGYELHLVPVKYFSDGTRKGDVDARLAFEAMRYYDEYEKAIFLTGDGDYFWLFEYLLENGKNISLFAHRDGTARELRKLFGPRFTDLAQLRRILEFLPK